MQNDKLTYDVLIIGGGAVGCAVARELSRFRLTVAVAEREADVAAGTSGRNSAVVHAGFNNRPGSRMARLCVAGSQGFEALCRQLDVPYRKTGKLLLAFDQEDLAVLKRLLAQGEANGCRGLTLWDQRQLRAQLPQVGGIGALFPGNRCVRSLSLHRGAGGKRGGQRVRFFLDHPVTAIEALDQGFSVGRRKAVHYPLCGQRSRAVQRPDRCACRCTGLPDLPLPGEYFILDQVREAVLPLPVYPAPRAGAGGLGVHLTPTIHGNLLIGPSAEYLEDPEDTASTRPVMDELFRQAQQLLPGLDRRQIIGSYAGLRPKLAPPGEGGYRDFVIREDRPGLVDLVGIESPGLTASLPIAREVVALLECRLPLTPKETFQPQRRGIPRFRTLPPEEQAALIAADPDYGEVFCRCQTVTRAEVRQAIENPLGSRPSPGSSTGPGPPPAGVRAGIVCRKSPRCWWRNTVFPPRKSHTVGKVLLYLQGG